MVARHWWLSMRRRNEVRYALVIWVMVGAALMPISATAKQCVVLLHGLGRSAASMQPLAAALQQAGYLTFNQSYPSRRYPIERLVELALDPALDFCARQQASHIHIVTHSLGGILVRQKLQRSSLFPISRVVMLGPPNQGSEVVDYLRNWRLFRWITGPAGQQLGRDQQALVRQLQPVAAQVGVIAGNRSADPWFNFLFAGQHDGKVSVQSTRLPEMQDFIELPVGHTFMMRDDEVIRQTLTFLRDGCFQHRA